MLKDEGSPVASSSHPDATCQNNKIQGTPSRPHPVFAGICDFYLLATALTAVALVLDSLFPLTLEGPVLLAYGLIMLILCIGVTTIYHKKLAAKKLWLSPGENLAGFFIIEGEKKWWNPYGVNRWLLFAITILVLIDIGNQFDGAQPSAGGQIFVGDLVIPILRVLVQVYGLILVGRGKLRGLLINAAVYSFVLILATLQYGDSFFYTTILLFYGGAVALMGLGFTVYTKLRVKDMSNCP